MPKPRRKLSAVLRDFEAELNRLEGLDAQNQVRFSTSSSPRPSSMSKHQLHFLTEAIFFRAYRAYESFVRDVFILYCLGKRPRSGNLVIPYMHPNNFAHAEQLIQSSMRYLDWTNPDEIVNRAALYLKDGFPIKLPFTTHNETLHDYRRIRNHIAHDSKESLNGYKTVLRKHYATIPLSIPSPGEFLLVKDNAYSNKYKLLVFFALMRTLSYDLT